MPKLTPGTLDEFFWWIQERYKISQAKERGDSWPWTDDPYLRDFKFCNVFREQDTVTRFIKEKYRDPYADDEGTLIANIMLARSFNWPPTLIKIGYIKEWDSDERISVEDILEEEIAAGRKVWTDAYIIRGAFGMKKHESVLNTFDQVWAERHELYKKARDTRSLQEMFMHFQNYPYIGVFMAYEFVTDLRHTPVLSDATDIMTWASAGPGAERGLKRLYGGRPDINQPVKLMRDLLAAANETAILEDVPRMEMRDVEHSLCEYDKWMRVKHGEGPSRRYVRSVQDVGNGIGSDGRVQAGWRDQAELQRCGRWPRW